MYGSRIFKSSNTLLSGPKTRRNLGGKRSQHSYIALEGKLRIQTPLARSNGGTDRGPGLAKTRPCVIKVTWPWKTTCYFLFSLQFYISTIWHSFSRDQLVESSFFKNSNSTKSRFVLPALSQNRIGNLEQQNIYREITPPPIY